MFILFVNALLKVVSYYDLCVLSMSGMGFKQKSLGGWGELYPVLFWNFPNFARPLRYLSLSCNDVTSCFTMSLCSGRHSGRQSG